MLYASEERLLRLCAALEGMVGKTDGLESLSREGARDGERCAIKLSAPHGPISVLRVSNGRLTVTTRSAGLHAAAGDTEIVDDLGIDLNDGFSWDDVRCESPDELARLLVKHMLRRTHHADPEPGSPDAAAGAASSES
jgi:hypothetical protein